MRCHLDDLMKCYLDVCNQALALNKERFPFREILGAAEKSEQGKIIEVNIIDADPNISYAMTLGGDGIVAVPHSACTDCKCDRKWQVTKNYLEDVAKNPQNYMQNPAKINWEWMYDVDV